MSTERIDAAIADATIAPVETPKEEVSATEPTEQPQEGALEAAPVVKDPWPKSAKNKVSRLEGEKRALRAREQQLIAEMNELRSKVAPKEDGPPNAEDPKFQSYDDLVEAKMDWKLKQFQAESQKQQQQQNVSFQEQQWINQRVESVDKQTETFVEQNPQYAEILNENMEIVQYFSPEIKRVFLEADNAPLAFIALAEEGKLESLLQMTPAKAAMEIAKAEIRGEAMLKAKPPITKAPEPMSPNKGSGTGTKLLDNMSYAELKAQGFVGRKT